MNPRNVSHGSNNARSLERYQDIVAVDQHLRRPSTTAKSRSRVNALFPVFGIPIVLAWMALATCNQIVRVPGRIRGTDSMSYGVRPQEVDAEVSAMVEGVSAVESEAVVAGQPLVYLDSRKIDNRLAQQAERIDSREKEMRLIKEERDALNSAYVAKRSVFEMRLAKARLAIRNQQMLREHDISDASLLLDSVQKNVIRIEKLYAHRAESESVLDLARYQVASAKITLRRAMMPICTYDADIVERELRAAELEHELHRKQDERLLIEKSRELSIAQLELDQLKLERKKYVIRSPIDGLVTQLPIQPGDYVSAGGLAIVVTPSQELVFETRVPSDRMKGIRRGLKARITADRYSKRRFGTVDGTIVYVAPDSQTEELADGTITAKYLVRIAIEIPVGKLDEDAIDLDLGMLGTAEIIVQQRSILDAVVEWICVVTS